MHCIYCGAQLNPDESYCSACLTSQNSIDMDKPPSKKREDWYFISEGIRYGPQDISSIIHEVNKGTVQRDTYVWNETMRDWAPAYTTSLVSLLGNTVPQTPAELISNKYVWALATIPLTVSIFLELAFGYSGIISIITIALNIYFLNLDIKAMEATGRKPDSWVWLGFLLVPVYLFIRASKTDQKNSYALVWCFIFLFYLLL